MTGPEAHAADSCHHWGAIAADFRSLAVTAVVTMVTGNAGSSNAVLIGSKLLACPKGAIAKGDINLAWDRESFS